MSSVGLEVQHSAGSSMLSTQTTQREASAQPAQPSADDHDVSKGEAFTFDNYDRAAAAARTRPKGHKECAQHAKVSRAAPQTRQLQQALNSTWQNLPAQPLQDCSAPAQYPMPAQQPAMKEHSSRLQQYADTQQDDMLEGQGSADGLDLLMLAVQAAQNADAAGQTTAPDCWQEQQATRQLPPAMSGKQEALLAACASALDQAQHSSHGVFMAHPPAGYPCSAGADADESVHMHRSAQTGTCTAEQASTDDDAAARDAHTCHAIAAALAAMQSRAAEAGSMGRSARSMHSDHAGQAAGACSRPRRAAARDADILRQVMLQEDLIGNRVGRQGSSSSRRGHSTVDDRLASLQYAAQLHQQRQQQQQQQQASLPPLPPKKQSSSSPAARKRGRNAVSTAAAAHSADDAQRRTGVSLTQQHSEGPASKKPRTTRSTADPMTSDAPAAPTSTTAVSASTATCAGVRLAGKAAPGVAKNSTAPNAAAPRMPHINTQQQRQVGDDANTRAAAGRPPTRDAAARASEQIAATAADAATAGLSTKAPSAQLAGKVGGSTSAAGKAPQAAHAAASGKLKRARPGAETSKGLSVQAGEVAAGIPATSKARGRPGKVSAGADSSSGSDRNGSSSGSDDDSSSDDEDYKAGSKRQHRCSSKQTSQRARFVTTADGVVVVTVNKAAAAAAAPGKRTGPKGGRPLGAGNKNELQPRSTNSAGQAAYGCRSQQYRGVYMSQRVTVRWRTQFSYARKVRPAGSAGGTRELQAFAVAFRLSAARRMFTLGIQFPTAAGRPSAEDYLCMECSVPPC